MNDIERKITEAIGRSIALMEVIKTSRAELEELGASRKTISETATQARRLATNLGKLKTEIDSGRAGVEAAKSLIGAASNLD